MKYSSVPSKESAGPPSMATLFTTGPKFTGVDHVHSEDVPVHALVDV